MTRIARGIKGRAIRNADDKPLSLDQLNAFVPSIFSNEADESRSSCFAPVCTYDSIKALQDEGFEPFYAIQTNSRDDNKRMSARHMIRMRDVRNKSDGVLADEVIIVNANDGTSAFNLMAGQFRFVCANGLVLGNIEQSRKVYHKGKANSIVIEGVYDVLKDYEELKDTQEIMKGYTLNNSQVEELAQLSYYTLNPVDPDYVIEHRKLPELQYDPMSLVLPQRAGDKAKDLFTVFNVIQERATKGGIKRYQGRRTAAISNINRDVTTNLDLWGTAVTYLDNIRTPQY